MKIKTTDELRHELFKSAKAAQKNAHSPYSHVRIGAAIRDAKGRIFNGCNVENASYGATICAERTAAVKAVSEGIKSPLTHVLVMSSFDEAWPPCGMCRQVLSEFCRAETVVLLANKSKIVKEMTFAELMPMAFSSEFLPEK